MKYRVDMMIPVSMEIEARNSRHAKGIADNYTAQRFAGEGRIDTRGYQPRIVEVGPADVLEPKSVA